MFTQEEIDRKILEYQKRHSDKNFQFHNVYYIYSEDRDGNVTGEAYGINLMTNYGFNRLCTLNDSTNNSQSLGFFIGTGTTPPTFSDTAMEHNVIGCSGYTAENTTISTDFDKTTGIISSVVRMGYGYFDYTISGYTEDINITEIGVGISATSLYYHFLVRDEHGNLSSVVKRPNEKTWIYVYHTFCLSENVMLDGLVKTNPEYILLEPTSMWNDAYDYTLRFIPFLNDRIYCWNSGDYYFNSQYNRQYSSRLGDFTRMTSCISSNTIYQNNEITYTFGYTNSYLLENNRDIYIGSSLVTPSGNCDYSYTGKLGFYIETYDKLAEPEEIVCDDIFTNNPDSLLIDDQYGYRYDNSSKNGAMPVVDYNITSLKMFNIQDNDFTISELYNQNSNFESFECFNKYMTFLKFLCPDGVRRTISVFVNPWVNMKIKKFTNTGITIFACDKAWDIDTWTQIPNIAEVPDGPDPDKLLANKRYYVSYSEQALYYKFQDQYYPKIIPMTEHVDTGISHLFQDGMIVGSDDYNWFSDGYKVFFLKNDNTLDTAYEACSDSTYSTSMYPSRGRRYAYKDKYLIFNQSSSYCNHFKLCKVSTDPLSREFMYGHVVGDTPMSVYCDDNNGKFVVCWNSSVNKAEIINLDTDLSNSVVITHDMQSSDYWEYGRINTSTGAYESNSNPYIRTKNFIDIPNNNSVQTTITVDCLLSESCSLDYSYRQGKFYIVEYDENETFLRALSTSYQNRCTTCTLSSDARKIKICMTHSTDTWRASVAPSYIESCIVTFTERQNRVILDNVKQICCIKDTDYLIYTKDTDYLSKWYVIDMNDPSTILQTFEIDSGNLGGSFGGSMGFSHYAYIRLNDKSNVYSTWLYNINTQQVTNLVDMNFDISFRAEDTRTYQILGNDRCLIINTGSNVVYIISEEDPTKWYTISSKYTRWLCLKYINDGRSLILAASMYGSSYHNGLLNAYYVYDVGVFLKDKKWKNGEPYAYYTLPERGDRWTSYKTFCYPYKYGILSYPIGYTSYSYTQIHYYPIESFVPHKITGTTKTIQAYNNPIKFGGKTFSFTRTNDMTKLGLSNDG